MESTQKEMQAEPNRLMVSCFEALASESLPFRARYISLLRIRD
jgi:hypothetical protein